MLENPYAKYHNGIAIHVINHPSFIKTHIKKKVLRIYLEKFVFLSMFLHVINYIVRISIVAIGVVLVSGVLFKGKDNSEMFTVMGIVFILFGLYRIVIYRMKSKQYDFKTKQFTGDTDDEED